MSSNEIDKMRQEAKKLMAGIFENFRARRSVSSKIGECKKSMNAPMEDYVQEKLLMEKFNVDGGNSGRLFSMLIQDSLEAQGKRPLDAIYNDVEIDGISALRSDGQADEESLKSFVKGAVPGASKLDVGFVQGRRAAIISWAIEFGYGKPANIIEPFGKSIDSAFWIIGSRPYRHRSIDEAIKFNCGTILLKLPNIFGRQISYEELDKIDGAMERMPALIDITYSEIGKNGRPFTTHGVRGSSVMVYGLPGTVGFPWETAAIIGEQATVKRTLERFYSIWGIKAKEFPGPSSDVSPAIKMLEERSEELSRLRNGLISLPEYGPFAILEGSASKLPGWARPVDASNYGNYNGMSVINLLK